LEFSSVNYATRRAEMKKSRFTETQIVKILKGVEGGRQV
jgi:hypothetical protein